MKHKRVDTPVDRRNCGLGETLANLLLIGCAVLVAAAVLAGLVVVVIVFTNGQT